MTTKTAVEEVMALRYMLYYLGIKVTKPSCILGDNHSMILNSTIPSSFLKKKHVAISYYMVREATAAKIEHPVKIKGDWNVADVPNKPQIRKVLSTL
eukprot:10376375-Ditylum_brightwellii.AAC.1